MYVERTLEYKKTIKPHYHSVDELVRDTTFGITMLIPLKVYKIRVREEYGNRIVYVIKYTESNWTVLDSPTDYSGAGKVECKKARKLEERWRRNKVEIKEYEIPGELYWALYTALTQIQ